MTDFEVIWFGQGAELARRMQALREELDARPDLSPGEAAQLIGEVLNCDYNPLPDQLPELGDPPRLRPAAPDRGYFITQASAAAQHAARRADHPYTDPGDGRTECATCGKWVWPVTHSCKRVPVTEAAWQRRAQDPGA